MNAMEMIGYRYRLGEQLGAGGMGTVYRAYDRLNATEVALKQVNIPVEFLEFMSRATLGATTGLWTALAEEFKTLASLRHPHIISVLDYGFDEQLQPYYTMELLSQPATLLAYGADKTIPDKINLIIQVLQALAYLHRRGVIHRDLKPDNVLVVDGQAKVLDFGLAVSRGRQTEDMPAGTLPYMAPEVLSGQSATSSADLYAVGVMAFQLLAGELPFQSGGSLDELVEAIIGQAADWSALPLHAELKAVISRLLTKTPAERYASAPECILAFSQAIGQEPPAETVALRESFIQAAEFVGRQRELQQLKAALQQAISGTGSGWLIGGESGVGKSRLLDELRTQALVEGALVVRGQAVDGGGLPYQLWREPLRRLVLSVELSDLEAGVLKPIVPDIAQLLERTIPDAPDLLGEPGQQRLMLTILDLFKRQAQPLVLLLEDLQWSSESLEPLKRLNALTGDLRLLIVANYRSDERPDLPDGLPNTHVMLLARLSDDEIAELSAGMLGEGGRDPLIVERLQQETEGNTFFMVEVVRALAEAAGRLGDIGQMTLPHSILAGDIQKIVRRRLERIPEHLRGVLKLAAVAGREIELNVLRAMVQSSLVDEWLQVGSDVAVLDIQDQDWRFAHDKLRQVILIDLGKDETRHLNEQVAEAIETVYPDNSAYAQRLFDHWYMAGNPAKVAQYGRATAEQLQTIGAYKDSVSLLERALAVQPANAGTAHMWLLKCLGYSQSALGEYPRALECYTQSLALARTSGDIGYVIDNLSGIQEIQHTQGEIEAARQNIDEAIMLAQKLQDDRQTAKVLMNSGNFYRDSDNLLAREHFERALKLFEKIGDLEGQAACRFNLAVVIGLLGEREQAFQHIDAAMMLFRQVDNRRGMFGCLNTSGNMVSSGDPVRAEALYREALHIARETGDKKNLGIALNNLANLLLDAGRYQDVLGIQRESLAIAADLNAQVNYAGTLLNIALTHHELGDFATARRDAEAGIMRLRTLDGPRYLSFGLSTLASIVRKQGDAKSARSHAQEAIDIGKAIGETWSILLGQLEIGAAEAELGSYDAATMHLQGVQSLCEQHDLPIEKTMVLMQQGVLAQIQGDLTGARSHFQEGLALAERMNNAINIAQGSAYLAFAEFLFGNLEVSHKLTRHGLTIAARIGSARVQAHLLAVQACLNESDGQPVSSAELVGCLMEQAATEAFVKTHMLMPLRSRLEKHFGTRRLDEHMAQGRARTLNEMTAAATVTLP